MEDKRWLRTMDAASNVPQGGLGRALPRQTARGNTAMVPRRTRSVLTAMQR